MLTGTPLDLTGLGDVLQAIGIAYWLLTAIAIAAVLFKARGWVLKTIGVAAVLGVLVLPPAWDAVDQIAKQKEAQRRLDESIAMFKRHCESAGEKIYKMVDNVEGVVWMKWRPGSSNMYDQYRLDDPYGQDCSGDGCILQLVAITVDPERYPAASSRHPGRYRYVESEDPADGKWYRYVGAMKLPSNWTPDAIARHKARTGEEPSGDSNRAALNRQEIQQRSARFGITWDDLSTKEDRDHWIAGSSLKVIDLQTNEVIAERVGYMIDHAQGSTAHARQPWTYAAGNACPAFKLSDTRDPILSSRSRDFIARVLKPIKGE